MTALAVVALDENAEELQHKTEVLGTEPYKGNPIGIQGVIKAAALW